MRAFLITSPKFTGTAELVYNDAGVLVRIDTSGTDMNCSVMHKFKGAVATHIDNLRQSFTPGTTVIETGFEVTFEMFWNKYGYKVERKRTLALWNKMSQAQQVSAYFSIEAYERFLKRKGGKMEKKFPDSYLRSEAYETDWDKIK